MGLSWSVSVCFHSKQNNINTPDVLSCLQLMSMYAFMVAPEGFYAQRSSCMSVHIYIWIISSVYLKVGTGAGLAVSRVAESLEGYG